MDTIFYPSIWLVLLYFAFNKCLDEDLDNDTDCIILAKKYADIRAKLVFENTKAFSNSNYSKRKCCIQHYLKGTYIRTFKSKTILI